MVTIQIQNGAISTGVLPKMIGYQKFTDELEKLVPYMNIGQIAMDPNIGIMGEIVFVNGQNANIITQRNGNKIYYSLNGNIHDRESAVNELINFRHNLENVFKTSNVDMSAQEIFECLERSCKFRSSDGGIEVFDNVITGGSDGQWSSRGDKLTAYWDVDSIKFVYDMIDCGDTHIEYNNNTQQVKYYPGDITVKDIQDICTKNGVILN